MEEPTPTFLGAYNGYFRNMLGWNDLDQLWNRLRADASKGWYIYAVGETPPQRHADSQELETFIGEIDNLLRTEHDEDYCGIVYVDQPEEPGFIKIYDPHNLGSVCGSGFGPPPLPGWILSLIPPENLETAMPQTGSRRRWWERIFG